VALSSQSPPQISLTSADHDLDAVLAPSIQWLSATDTTHSTPTAMVPQFSFYTPFTPGGSPGTCGQVIYDDFHVTDISTTPTTGTVFPGECSTAAMTPQEQEFEYSIFELDSCVPQAPPE
jgi:hypothetical protein